MKPILDMSIFTVPDGWNLTFQQWLVTMRRLGFVTKCKSGASALASAVGRAVDLPICARRKPLKIR